MTMNRQPDIHSDNQPDNQAGIQPDIQKEIKKIQHSEKFLRERKFMTILPLLILPFLLFIFMALGGGTAAGNTADTKQKNGINTSLPGPNLTKKKDKDKLGVYEEANKDSLKLHDQMKNDPYYRLEHPGSVVHSDSQGISPSSLQNILEHHAAKYGQPDF